jgi:hypothetical protein
MLKASLPEGYIAVRTCNSTERATTWEIYRGGAHNPDNHVGDIIHTREGIWRSHPRGRRQSSYRFVINAVSDLTIIDSLLPQDNPTPPF